MSSTHPEFPATPESPSTPVSGTVLALTTAPSYGADLMEHTSVTVTDGEHGGIEGDRHCGQRRAVTIVCTGELATAAAQHGVETIDAVATRRNIVVDLPRLPRKHGTRITIGDCELEVWRDCAPCNMMDEAFGEGARAALVQRCGISATVVTGGVITIGDTISIF